MYSVSSLKQQSADRYVAHTDTLSWFRTNQSLLFLHNAACLSYSLRFDPIGARTHNPSHRGEHANHYPTDVVVLLYDKTETLIYLPF